MQGPIHIFLLIFLSTFPPHPPTHIHKCSNLPLLVGNVDKLLFFQGQSKVHICLDNYITCLLIRGIWKSPIYLGFRSSSFDVQILLQLLWVQKGLSCIVTFPLMSSNEVSYKCHCDLVVHRRWIKAVYNEGNHFKITNACEFRKIRFDFLFYIMSLLFLYIIFLRYMSLKGCFGLQMPTINANGKL